MLHKLREKSIRAQVWRIPRGAKPSRIADLASRANCERFILGAFVKNGFFRSLLSLCGFGFRSAIESQKKTGWTGCGKMAIAGLRG